MGLPTNDQNNAGCEPVSSNCVIWQGPDIPCIKLCKGDSISDVTYKLALRLCEVLDQLDVSTYDLSCLVPACPTINNIHDLIQYLINKICELQDCCNGNTPGTNGCPDCIVNIAPCFQYTNSTGDLITTMQLQDYVLAIGVLVCQLSTSNGIVNSTLQNQEIRIKSLEDKPDPVAPEILILSSCLQPGRPPADGWPIEVIVEYLEQQFCELRAATGLPTDLYLAINKQCPALDSSPTMTNPGTSMASIPGWITQANYGTVADSLNNMWLTICDIRSALQTMKTLCCNVDCEDVQITLVAEVVGVVLNLYLTGFVPPGFLDCAPGGNQFTIQDSAGNIFTTFIPVITNVNQPPVQINLGTTPIDPNLDITITINGCWKNTAEGITCGRIITYFIDNDVACPTITYVPGFTNIAWSFNNALATPVDYTMELWDSTGTTLLSTQVVSNPAPGLVSGNFLGLTMSTLYKIRVKVTISGTDVYCPFSNVTTLVLACAGPTAVSAIGVL